MTRLTIDLPEDVARDLEEQAREAGKSREEYAVGMLAATRATRERLEQMLLEGLDSGPGQDLTPEYLGAMDRRLKGVVNKRRNSCRARQAS